ncbi:MAG: cellulase family glycosylhydrolase, partial [Lutibacter sp.]|nr:cellulase family glycosylhydrolase [Lutibacter sp.]
MAWIIYKPSMRTSFILLSFLLCSLLCWGQHLQTAGKKIVDHNGQEVILRGVGMGGWMLQEGYMMQSADIEGAGTQHGFKQKLVELIGETKTAAFYDAWLANHVTKTDIDSLASWGFNSVRLPMHYNLFTLPIEEEPVAGSHTWLPKGFEMVDRLLDWCASNEIYLILDLHAAPGGQGYNADICDYDETKPSLWESSLNRDKTVALWRKLAERYHDKAWIGGYDLLNETNWNMDNNDLLKSLYLDITTAIRAVDQTHIIFIEGNWFANDFTGLTPPWDSNMAYSFHKYWGYNSQESIQWMLDMRNQHNIPIWCGESGENSNVWFRDAIKLFEEQGIGWSWWPFKRFETTVSPFSVATNAGYQQILNYWRGQAAMPSVDNAYNSLMQIADNLLVANNTFNKDVVDAMIRQPQTDATIPFSTHTIPGLIHLSDYDLGTLNHAYYDRDYANYQQDTGEFTAWNAGWVYRNDGVDIESNETGTGNGLHLSHLHQGEWTKYTVHVSEPGAYTVKATVASTETGGQFHLLLDGESITEVQQVSSTGGWTQFSDKNIYNVVMGAGSHSLVFQVDSDVAFNISSLEFTKTATVESVPFNPLNAYTGTDEKSVRLVLNHAVDQATLASLSPTDFDLNVNGNSLTISAYQLDPENPRVLVISLEDYLYHTDQILLGYTADKIASVYGQVLGSFTNEVVINNLPDRHWVPGKIESEDYFQMQGLSPEDTTDEGGGVNLGYTDVGDYADYRIFVSQGAAYQLDCRLAAAYQSGRIGFYLMDNGAETYLGELNTPVTGGWQQWSTTGTDFFLPKGIHTLRIKVLAAGFNINWMQFTVLDGDNDGVSDTDDQCPNSAAGAMVDANGCEIFAFPPSNYSLVTTDATCVDGENGAIEISIEDTSYEYVLSITGQDPLTYNETTPSPLLIDGLTAGSYQVCVTIEGIDHYEQCFNVVVGAPELLTGRAEVDQTNGILTLLLSGADTYYVMLNGSTETVATNVYKAPLEQGLNSLKVSTDLDCQGTVEEQLFLFDTFACYPNPTKGTFQELLPNNRGGYTQSLFNLQGKEKPPKS